MTAGDPNKVYEKIKKIGQGCVFSLSLSLSLYIHALIFTSILLSRASGSVYAARQVQTGKAVRF